MSHANDLAIYLASKIAALTVGTNVFVGSEPTTPADCVTLYDTGGSAPYQDYSGTEFVTHPSVQIRVRNSAYLTGDILINDIKDVVKRIVHTSLSGTRYDGVFISNEPIHLGKIDTNAGLANVWTLNINLICEE